MTDRVPSFTLLIPGPFREASQLVDALASAGIRARPRTDAALQPGDVEIELVSDDALGAAFRFGRGPLPDDVRRDVEHCRRAAVIEVALQLQRDHAAIAALGRALRNAGGVAVRMERSGGAWAWEPWLERLDAGSMGALYECAVVIVGDGSTLFTCGMHHFDRPDAEIAMDEPRAAMAWLDTFHMYQLIEDPVLASGHTFQPDVQAHRRVLERWPDARHASSDGRHNPFGLFRFLGETAKARQVSDVVPTIMPSLAAMLMSQERKLGRALTRAEVEHFVQSAPAIALPRRDARELERSRGYADIDPELAWEHWQIVRRTNANA